MVTNSFKTGSVYVVVTGTLNTTMTFKQLRIWVFIIAISSCDCVLFAQQIPPPQTCERQCNYFARGNYADCRSRGFSEIPTACRDVLSIDLSFNELSKLDNTTLESFTNLEDLTMKQALLAFITPGAFRPCAQNIARINLAANFLHTLPTDAFSNLPVLEVLILDENRLTHLEGGCLKNLPILKHLYLNSNNLSFLDASVFQDCPAVETLYLNNNRIFQINTHSFFGLGNLNTLFMENNLLMDIFEGAFNHTRKLKSLILNNNQLSTFDFGILDVLEVIESLQLINNQISAIEGTFSRPYVTVKLQHNPISCNCSLQGFVESALISNVKLNASCAVPAKLANIEITQVNFEHCGHKSLQQTSEIIETKDAFMMKGEKGEVTLGPRLREEGFKEQKTLHLWIVAISVWSMIIFLSSLIFVILYKRRKECKCNKNNQYWDANGSHTSGIDSQSSQIRTSDVEPIYLEIPETTSSNRDSEIEISSSLLGSDSHEFPTVSQESRDQPVTGENRITGSVNHIDQNRIETLV